MTTLTAPPTAGSGSTSPLGGRRVGVSLRTQHCHVALLMMSGVGLLLGTYTGLGRAGGAHHMLQPDIHGVIMALGFLGLLIALERASALASWSGYLAAVLTAASTVLLAAPLPRMLAGALLTSFAGREMALHGNVAALAAFVIIEVVAVRRGVLAARPREHAGL